MCKCCICGVIRDDLMYWIDSLNAFLCEDCFDDIMFADLPF